MTIPVTCDNCNVTIPTPPANYNQGYGNDREKMLLYAEEQLGWEIEWTSVLCSRCKNKANRNSSVNQNYVTKS